MARLPERVGPYEIDSRIGAGGMAETYRATRRGPGGFVQQVCLKRIRPDLEDNADFVRCRASKRPQGTGVAWLCNQGS